MIDVRQIYNKDNKDIIFILLFAIDEKILSFF